METHSYRQNGAEKKLDDREPYYGDEKADDTEAGPPTVGYKGKEDPFGDETHSEVKYRTMAWWYALKHLPPVMFSTANRRQASRHE